MIKEDWYKSKWGKVFAVILLPLFIIWYVWVKSNLSKNTKIAVTVMVCIIVAVASAVAILKPTTTNTAPIAKEAPAPRSVASEPNNLLDSPLTRISNLAKQQYDKYEVVVSTLNGGAAEDGNGPWVVNLNSPLNAFGDCFGAKLVAFKTAKNLFIDDVTSKNIAQLRISLSSQAQMSLGSSDARQINKDDWESNGPTTFARSLAASGSMEKTDLPAQSQTYWRPLNTDCSAR